MSNVVRNGEAFRLLESDVDHAKATAFNMLFMVWRRETTAAAYRRGIMLVRELGTHFREGVGVCQVIEVDALPPDGETRRAFVELLKLDCVRHLSLLHDGTGFKAASIRAVVSGVYTLARPKFKVAVHSSVGDSARWHAAAQAELGRTEGAAMIEGIVRRLRALHREQYQD